jgi:hypothetical protein
MKFSAATAKSAVHTFGHDMHRDWESWSSWERRTVRALVVLSTLLGVFWLALGAGS